jgi:hypothetical protein
MTRVVVGLLFASTFALAAPGRARADDVADPPVAPAAFPQPTGTIGAPAAKPPFELGLGGLQLLAGYAGEVGGALGLAASGIQPKALGIHSDYGSLVLVSAVVPAFAAGAVCGVGSFSQRYEGGCATSFLGAYAGATLGVLLGMLLAPRPNPDDTVAFERSMTGLVGMVVLSPIGALIGHELGKHPIW